MSLFAPRLKAGDGTAVTAAVRPEEIRIVAEKNDGGVSGEVYAVLPAGSETIVQVRREGRIFHVRVMGEAPLDVGDRVFLRFVPEAVSYFDQRQGTRIDVEGD